MFLLTAGNGNVHPSLQEAHANKAQHLVPKWQLLHKQACSDFQANATGVN
eukprot:CAMPEP_0171097132 /NCGR_PEP_ID=MMETSP0766_2-20121228/47046_1 /TAXON_ID=439317 /ORGANISM="Gambierdiscus australes, Strain CAWD 149" /LENGTH=49 /DNA_ID= /DNA_START= /DNA_END= /DNA_ORIENTATION=